eukprot:4653746-Prymnesium_polylepis.1
MQGCERHGLVRDALDRSLDARHRLRDQYILSPDVVGDDQVASKESLCGHRFQRLLCWYSDHPTTVSLVAGASSEAVSPAEVWDGAVDAQTLVEVCSTQLARSCPTEVSLRAVAVGVPMEAQLVAERLARG